MEIDSVWKSMTEIFEPNPFAGLAAFLAATEALQMLEHSHHWQTKGESFYGDHLLFQRLYEAVLVDIDLIGEKLIGVSGDASLTNYFKRVKAIEMFLKAVTPHNQPYVVVSHDAELMYVRMGGELMDQLEQAGLLTRGLEQMLGNVLDKHEEHIYLLDQRVKQQAS
jgi:DNA-binding ferritin-like protein